MLSFQRSLFLCLCVILTAFVRGSKVYLPDQAGLGNRERSREHQLGASSSSRSSKKPSSTLRLVNTKPLIRQDKDDEFFTPEYTEPKEPAASIKSDLSLTEELRTWMPITLFNNLINEQEILAPEAPYVILAPENKAFIRLLQRLLPKKILLSGSLNETSALVDAVIGSDVLSTILRYHVISGSLTEQELTAKGNVTTLGGAKLDFSDLPIIRDGESSIDEFGQRQNNKSRIYRSIETRNGRLMIINGVLLPTNLSVLAEELSLDEPEIGNLSSQSTGLFEAPDFITDANISANFEHFVRARLDTTVLSALFQIYKSRLSSLLTSTKNVHFFAPTDRAFVALAKDVLGDELTIDFDNLIPGLVEAAAAMFTILSGKAGIPTVPELLLYHTANTSARYESLFGEGPQPTFFANATISITEEGVVDDDSGRANARRLGTFPTLQGWVTVIDSVLLPFDLGVAKIVANATLSGGDVPQSCPENDEPACFAGEATVKLSDGHHVKMTDLEAGDEVTVDSKGKTSKIYLFTHRSPKLARFVEVEMETGRSVRLTRGHYLYANGRLVSAGNVRKGDMLETESGLEKVVTVRSVVRRGLFAPHSLHGDLMVDGVRVSAYTNAVAPRLAHAILAPVRAVAVWADVREPLGALFYGGVADRWVRVLAWMVGGTEQY